MITLIVLLTLRKTVFILSDFKKRFYMRNKLFEHFRSIERSNSRLKYQEDCHVPAIGKMSGCITTDILLPIHSGLVGSETEKIKELVNMK
jgi:hypothetical protein